MPCYYPLRGFDRGDRTVKGKIKYLVLKRGASLAVKGVDLPCGRCIGCRLDYSRDWAIRSYFESQSYPKDHSWFVTLTYDDDHLVRTKGFDRVSGEVFDSSTLVVDHYLKFIKDLRRYYQYHFKHVGIRFIASGEYGDKSCRPHYHLLLFNLPIGDLVYWSSRNGHSYYRSKLLDRIWARGMVVVGEVSYQSSAYVARYVMKKQVGKDSRLHYESKGQISEFVRHSRMPGIGRSYFEKNYDRIYFTDEVFVNRDNVVVRCKPPSYYDRLFEAINPLRLEEIKAIRKESMDNHNDLVLSDSDYDNFEFLEVAEEVKKSVVKNLYRDKV